jgi:hypothetical protein
MSGRKRAKETRPRLLNTHEKGKGGKTRDPCPRRFTVKDGFGTGDGVIFLFSPPHFPFFQRDENWLGDGAFQAAIH